MPNLTTYESAFHKLVPESLAREVFSVVKVVRTDVNVSDRQVVLITKESIVESDKVDGLCKDIHNHCHDNDTVLIKIQFNGAYMYYTFILSALLTYRARWQYLPLPIVCIIDPDMPPMPANYSKAFVWRYQLRQTGSISGFLLMLGALNIQTVYRCMRDEEGGLLHHSGISERNPSFSMLNDPPTSPLLGELSRSATTHSSSFNE
jgi:hypothetical protein